MLIINDWTWHFLDDHVSFNTLLQSQWKAHGNSWQHFFRGPLNTFLNSLFCQEYWQHIHCIWCPAKGTHDQAGKVHKALDSSQNLNTHLPAKWYPILSSHTMMSGVTAHTQQIHMQVFRMFPGRLISWPAHCHPLTWSHSTRVLPVRLLQKQSVCMSFQYWWLNSKARGVLKKSLKKWCNVFDILPIVTEEKHGSHIATGMINVHFYGYGMYLSVLITFFYFAFEHYFISKTVKCFWVTLYRVIWNDFWGFNNCHLILQMQPHVIYFYGVTSKIRFMFLLFSQYPGTGGTSQNCHWNRHHWHATNSLERTRLSC